MKRELKPKKKFSGTITPPGDKSIAHRVALLSILAQGEITAVNFPDNEDCRASLEAARAMGVSVESDGGQVVLKTPAELNQPDGGVIDCANSATTARLLAGIIAGSDMTVTLTGDESLSRRPMDRIIEPLSAMGAEIHAENGRLPMRVVGKKLLHFEYQLPLPSAQVKSSLLLAAAASNCSVTVREDSITRDHTERLMQHFKAGIEINEIKPVLVPDAIDPRKKKLQVPETFKKEIILANNSRLTGGPVDIPGDFSTAAFFLAGAAIGRGSVTVDNVGLNPTRTEFLDYLKLIGCSVTVTGRQTVSGEPRGTVTVTRDSNALRPRKISGDSCVGLIDEIPIVAVIAAFTEGTTIIRGAAELRVKESDRLESIAENLRLMGIKCGVLDDGLVIEGKKELSGADFKSFCDHRIAMAFSVASCFLVGPSSIDDDSVVAVSCPGFYQILDQVTS